jgi:hypothetical protein
MPISVIQGGAIVLAQNVIYRARLEVVPPYGVGATEGAVSDELGKQGFANIRFYPKDKLPADWPPTESEDESGFMGKSYYLEGRFVLSARRIPLSELGNKVALRGMWIYLVPISTPSPGTPPVSIPGSAPPVSIPEPPSGASFDLGEQASKVVVGWLAATTAFWLTRRLMGHRGRLRG